MGVPAVAKTILEDIGSTPLVSTACISAIKSKMPDNCARAVSISGAVIANRASRATFSTSCVLKDIAKTLLK